MICDIFMYNGEDELLEIRLNELVDHVDYFVIGESNFSHSGIEKQLKFDKSKFERLGSRIVYIEIPNMPEKNNNPWFFEMMSRQYMFDVSRHNFGPDDIIIHGDLDEVPVSSKLIEVYNEVELSDSKITLCGDYWYLCCDLWGRKSEDAFVMKAKHLLEFDRTKTGQSETWYPAVPHYRAHRTNFAIDVFKKIPDSSNHFSSVGKLDNVVRKMKHFAHAPELDDKVLSEDFLKQCILNKEYMGAKLTKYNSHWSWPKHLVDNKGKWPYLFSEFYK